MFNIVLDFELQYARDNSITCGEDRKRLEYFALTTRDRRNFICRVKKKPCKVMSPDQVVKMEEAFAIFIAFGASFCVNFSTYLQKKAVDKLPRLRVRISWPIIRSFVTNVPWISAMVMDGLGTALFMVALIWLPVSIVEPIITAGIALLAYLAIKNLGEQPGRADFLAIGMTALGVIFLAVSLAGGLLQTKTYNPFELWAAAAATVAVAIALPLAMQVSGKGSVAAGLGVAGGLFIGIAGVFSRLLMGNFGGQWYAWLIACLLTYPLGFVFFQAGLQRGKAVVVAPIYNGLVVCIPIIVGSIALNEQMPTNPLLMALRISAFLLIVVGAIVLSRTTAATKSSPANQADEAGTAG